jgi:hypothetical protein
MPIQKYIKIEPTELNKLNIAYAKALRMLDLALLWQIDLL